MKKCKRLRPLRTLKKYRYLLCIILFAAAAAWMTGCVLHKSLLSFAVSHTGDFSELSVSVRETTAVPSPTAVPVLVSAQTSAAISAPTSRLTPTPTPTPSAKPASTPTDVPASTQIPSGGIVWYDGYADPRTITAETVTNPGDLTVLVNKYFAIPESYTPDLVLAESSKNQYLRSEANDAWNVMRAACEADTGYALLLCSGYRTFEAQAALYSKSIADRGIAHACSRNALEGRSEHNLGLALDISTTDAGVISSGFAKTKAGMWVGEHCAEYGFILRYPEDKTAITGYVYEPWHYRYVGVDLAETLYASGQTLEEYYGKVPVVPGGS